MTTAETVKKPAGAAESLWALESPVHEVWAALTDPGSLSQWFGTLAPPPGGGDALEFREGGVASLKFDDGDFFLLEVQKVDPCCTLSYVWANLTIGLEETVTWHLTPTPTGCLVRVTDLDHDRSPELARIRECWWRGVLHRLEQFLGGGMPIFGRAHDIDARIEIAGALDGVWALLTEPHSQERWLPLASGPLTEGGYLVVKDGQDVSRLGIADLTSSSTDHSLSFDLAHEEWLHPTTVHIELLPRREGTMVSVRHRGWEAISPDAGYQRRQRSRFTRLWFNVLSRFTMEYVRRKDIPSISMADVRAQLGEPDFHVFDVNARDKRMRGHLAGSKYLGPDPFDAGVLPPEKDAILVFYCFSAI